MTNILTPDLTPEQQSEPVTKGFLKQELDQKFDEFGKKMFKTFAIKDDIKELPTRDEMLQWKSEIIKSVDSISMKFKDHDDEHTANQSAHDRFEERIGVLEKKTGVSQA